MATFEIRPSDMTTDDYEPLAALWTELFPDLPRHADIWRDRDLNPHAGTEPWGRAVAVRDGSLLGMGEFAGCPLAGEPGQLQLGFAVPDGPEAASILDALHAALLRRLTPYGPPALVAYARDSHPWMLAFFERAGYTRAQRTAHSLLRRPAFTPDAGAQARAQLERAGCTLISAAELIAAGTDWQQRYHALEVALVGDIPFLGPVHPEPFERFLERSADPDRWTPEAVFLAHHQASSAWVGIALLHTFTQFPGYAFAGLTGVLREYRRAGIARALKLATIDYASNHGIDRIVALNEIDNPMLVLNRKLGFETEHVEFTMQKQLGAASP